MKDYLYTLDCFSGNGHISVTIKIIAHSEKQAKSKAKSLVDRDTYTVIEVEEIL